MHKKFEKAEAFSPAGITSFFEICDEKKDGSAIKDPLLIGARGGGFVISKGVLTRVFVKKSTNLTIKVSINHAVTKRAETTKAVIKRVLENTSQNHEVKVEHYVDVPIGSGFGSSGAGALSTALALNQALNLGLSYNELGRIAHVAEVECKTGLGTVGPLMLGGCILTTKSGAPGFNAIDRIPLRPSHKIVSVHFGPIPTKKIITKKSAKPRINEWGGKSLSSIIQRPTIENFMKVSKEFAEGIGLMTDKVTKAINMIESAGAIGATQNMIGEAVHSIVEEDVVEKVVNSVRKIGSNVIIAKLDNIGARLL